MAWQSQGPRSARLFTMSENSELIKTSLPAFAGSPQPYELASFAIVLEKPMTLIWLEMNGYDDEMPRFDRTKQLTLTEWLHMYRLMNYFGTRLESFNFEVIPLLFIESSSEELANVLKDNKNVTTLVTLLNKGFEKRTSSSVKMYPKDHAKKGNVLFEKLTKEYPDIAKQLAYIPVYVDDIIETYAERKATPEDLEKINTTWTKSGRFFTRSFYPFKVILEPLEWGPDKIMFKSTINLTEATRPGAKMVITQLIGFIFIPVVTGR